MPVRALIALDVGEGWRQRLVSEFPEVAFTFADDARAFLAAAPAAEVVLAHSFPREAATLATRLRWLQAGTSGVSHLLHREFRERGVTLTNARSQGVPMAENVLAMMFAFAARLPLFVESRLRREPAAPRAVREKFELEGQTLLILGLGDVGGALCRRAAALGMRVLGLRRRPEIPCAGAALVVGVDRLREVLPQADHITNTLPLTQGTRHFLAADEFALMRRGAYLYNVGGGATVDREALCNALCSGRLAGAGLDVTDPDPLPLDDPLWEMENVILTQHTAGASPRNNERIAAIFADNLRRYLAGQPLLHVVDQELGYALDTDGEV
jgi:phosphoglycerate dehydrogenase-like enzyme